MDNVSSLDYECWICGAPPGQPCHEQAAPDGMRDGQHSERGASCSCGALLPAGSTACPLCESLAVFEDSF